MAKRSGNTQPEEPELVEEMPTDEQWAELEQQREAERRARLAPYEAMHQQQTEQDELIAELYFKEAMRDLGE